MLEKRVPLLLDAGGGKRPVGHADVTVYENGEIEIEGCVTSPQICDLLTGEPTRNPLFAVGPFSIVPVAKNAVARSNERPGDPPYYI
jgi:hypothetical protein